MKLKLDAKGVIVAVLQVLIVCSLGAKLLHDRATRPRVWIKAFQYDPDLPIRGRYLSLTARAKPKDFPADRLRPAYGSGYGYVALAVENGELIATPFEVDTGVQQTTFVRWNTLGPQPKELDTIFLAPPIDFYIPEHAENPAHLRAGEELWAEVTIPKKGPPRPIRLGIKKDGKLTPIEAE